MVLGQWHVGTTKASTAHSSTTSNQVTVNIPSGTQGDDVLVAFLSRTDSYLPLTYDGWATAASCYKTSNEQRRCAYVSDCVEANKFKEGDATYCRGDPGFNKNNVNLGNGFDLATVALMRKRSTVSGSKITFTVRKNKPVWVILTALRGVRSEVRTFTGTSCDRKIQSFFPSVRGEKGDVLLLSMAFDDTSTADKWTKPPGTDYLGFVRDEDEAGSLYGYQFSSSKESGILATGGAGGNGCKDALISLVIRGNGSSGPPSPVSSPTRRPTSGPDNQNGKEVKGGYSNTDINGAIPECRGDCDRDSDCASGLKCLQRTNGENVPGCTVPDEFGPSASSTNKGMDVCYNPNPSTSAPLLKNLYGNTDKNIPACGGDCDNDDQCATGLKCTQRKRGEPVPGCSMDSKTKPGGAEQHIDFCYNPSSGRFIPSEGEVPGDTFDLSAAARSTTRVFGCGMAAVLFVLLA
jgi:hypothetical protein